MLLSENGLFDSVGKALLSWKRMFHSGDVILVACATKWSNGEKADFSPFLKHSLWKYAD